MQFCHCQIYFCHRQILHTVCGPHEIFAMPDTSETIDVTVRHHQNCTHAHAAANACKCAPVHRQVVMNLYGRALNFRPQLSSIEILFDTKDIGSMPLANADAWAASIGSSTSAPPLLGLQSQSAPTQLGVRRRHAPRSSRKKNPRLCSVFQQTRVPAAIWICIFASPFLSYFQRVIADLPAAQRQRVRVFSSDENLKFYGRFHIALSVPLCRCVCRCARGVPAEWMGLSV